MTAKQIIRNDDPYPDQTPYDVMTRWWPIGSGTLSNMASHTIFDPLALLIGRPSIAKAIASFIMFKTDVEFKIQIVSVPQQYGTIAVVHCPYKDNVSQRTLLSMDVGLIDVSKPQELLLKIPWLSPRTYELINLTGGALKMMNVHVLPIGDIRSIDESIAAPVRYRVFARMVNPHVAGHIVAQSSIGNLATGVPYTTAPTVGALAAGAATAMGMGSSTVYAAGQVYNFFAGSTKTTVKEVPVEPDNIANNPFGELVRPALTKKCLDDSFLTDDGYYGDNRLSHSLLDFITTPSYLGFNEMSGTGAVTLPITPRDLLEDKVLDRLSWTSQFFRFYRGGTKVRLRLCTSPLYTFRVGVVVTLDATTPAGMNGDYLEEVITVSGTTDVCITVPFLAQTPWLSCINSAGDPYVRFSVQPTLTLRILDNPPGMSTTTPMIQCTSWIAADKDFQFSSMCNTYDDVIEAQSFLRSEFDTNCLNIGASSPVSFARGKGSVFTIEEILQRFSQRLSNVIFDIPGQEVLDEPEDTFYLNNFDLWSALFLFYSGNIRYKVNLKGDPMAVVLTSARPDAIGSVAGSGPRVENGMVAVQTDLNSVLDFDRPFVSNTEVIPIQPELSFNQIREYHPLLKPLYSGATTTIEHVWVAGGQNFRLYFDYPPSILSGFWPTDFWELPP